MAITIRQKFEDDLGKLEKSSDIEKGSSSQHSAHKSHLDIYGVSGDSDLAVLDDTRNTVLGDMTRLGLDDCAAIRTIIGEIVRTEKELEKYIKNSGKGKK